eukprot:gene18495-24211_t
MLWPDGTQTDYDAIVGLKARTGILPQLGDIGSIGNKITHTPGDVLSGAKGAVDGFTSGAKSAVGGLKNLTTAMMSGMLFEDNSGHNASTTNHSTSNSNTKKITKSNPNGSSSNNDIKTAFNGINAALGLKKAAGVLAPHRPPYSRYGIKRNHRKLCIEPLHLPPEESRAFGNAGFEDPEKVKIQVKDVNQVNDKKKSLSDALAAARTMRENSKNKSSSNLSPGTICQANMTSSKPYDF